MVAVAAYSFSVEWMPLKATVHVRPPKDEDILHGLLYDASTQPLENTCSSAMEKDGPAMACSDT